MEKIINEAVHVITDESVDRYINAVLSALKYDLYSKAVDDELEFNVSQKRSCASILDQVGKDWTEFLRDQEEKEKIESRMFRYPVISEFEITDNENPCKNWIASDCKFKFVLDNKSNTANKNDIKDAFVTKYNGCYCVHCIEFEFYYAPYMMDTLKSTMRHEIKHAYDELMRHSGIENDFDARRKDMENPLTAKKFSDFKYREGDDSRIGLYSTKSVLDKKRDEDYAGIISLYNEYKNKFDLNPGKDISLKSVALMAECLYYLFPKEVKANYSTYYQQCVDDPDRLFTDYPIYITYINLLTNVIDGVVAVTNKKDKDGYNITRRINVFVSSNSYAFDKVKPYMKSVFKNNPQTPEELRETVISEIRKVTSRMRNIYHYVKSNKKSTYEKYNESVEKYYDGVLKRCNESYGEDYGIIYFTQEKLYRTPKYREKIEEINKQIFSK